MGCFPIYTYNRKSYIGHPPADQNTQGVSKGSWTAVVKTGNLRVGQWLLRDITSNGHHLSWARCQRVGEAAHLCKQRLSVPLQPGPCSCCIQSVTHSPESLSPISVWLPNWSSHTITVLINYHFLPTICKLEGVGPLITDPPPNLGTINCSAEIMVN